MTVSTPKTTSGYPPAAPPASASPSSRPARVDEAVYVDLPEVGSEVTAGQACGEIESVKSVSDLVAPAGGKVVAVNQDVVDDPKLATDDPHGTWLYEIEVAELPELMDSAAYEAFAKEA